MAQHAATVGEALAAVGGNITYHSPGATVSVLVGPGGTKSEPLACLRYHLDVPAGVVQHQNAELAYTIAVDFLRMLAQPTQSDWRIHFAHAKGLSKARYCKQLGCDVRLGQPFDALYFPATLLQSPVDAADPALAATAERFIAHLVRRHPLDIARQVEALLTRQLAGGACTLPVVARQLTLSERSLQRRLQEQGTSFDQIADRARRNLAHELLVDTQIPLTQICAALGYTESSTFNRSYKRWFGATPLSYRRQLRG
jgi:AraC-like DNA-binding protein